jgi:hypothetical protein
VLVAASGGTSTGGGHRRRLLLIGGAFVAIVILVVAGLVWRENTNNTPTTTAKKPTAVQSVQVEPKVSSYSPSGTGFRSKDGTWTTQSYKSAKFGGLKDGVGLVLDLGAAREVSSVEFNAGTGPLTVALRAGDDAGDVSGYTAVGDSSSASGSSKLTVPNGQKPHRYWMIWVTELAPQDGGYGATIRDVSVHAQS